MLTVNSILRTRSSISPATKSAAAASETAELIEDSIKKVSSGSKIADETAEALEEIARNIAIKANEAAKLAKRKTIKADDIKLAIKNL